MLDSTASSGQAISAAGRQYSRAYLTYVLAVLLLASTFSFIDRQLVTILLEPIKAEFGASDTQMGLLTGLAFALFYVTLGIPIARLADRYSRRNILAIAIGLWSAMTACCGLAGNFVQLALARIGVGIGEAGGGPPSQSMVADYFPPRQRGTALGILATGAHFGMLFSMFGGAVIAQQYGWRTAFLAVGIPGVALGILVRLTIDEPLRGRWEMPAGLPRTQPQNLLAALRELWRSTAFRRVALAVAITSLSGFGLATWTPSFFMRVHGLSLIDAGMVLGVAGTVGGLFGAIGGGMLSDRLARRDSSWLLKVGALGAALSLPVQMAFLLWPDRHTIAIAGFGLPVAALFMPLSALLLAFWMGPSFAAVQNLVRPDARALAAALMMLISNLIGMGAGPVLVGMLSDALQPALGADSIRYALLISLVSVVAGAVLFWQAGNHYRSEMAR